MKVNYMTASDTAHVLKLSKDFCNPALRLGDVYGPTEAFALQIDFTNHFLLCDVNSGIWKIAFFAAKDEEGTNPLVILQTTITDADRFVEFLKTFLEGIDKGQS